MNSVKVLDYLCPKNHRCPIIRVCPAGAIVQDTIFDAPHIDKKKCTDCGLCTRYCGYGAFIKE